MGIEWEEEMGKEWGGEMGKEWGGEMGKEWGGEMGKEWGGEMGRRAGAGVARRPGRSHGTLLVIYFCSPPHPPPSPVNHFLILLLAKTLNLKTSLWFESHTTELTIVLSNFL